MYSYLKLSLNYFPRTQPTSRVLYLITIVYTSLGSCNLSVSTPIRLMFYVRRMIFLGWQYSVLQVASSSCSFRLLVSFQMVSWLENILYKKKGWRCVGGGGAFSVNNKVEKKSFDKFITLIKYFKEIFYIWKWQNKNKWWDLVD